MVGEEADLPAGAVGDLVDMTAAREEHVATADADARAVRELLEAVRLRPSVAPHLQHGEGHAHQAAGAISVVGWKVAQDAALDFVAFDLHGDTLGHHQLAAGLDADVAVELEHALDRGGVRGEGEGCGEDDRSHRATLTALRSSVSKNGIGLKLKNLACLTAPL